MKPPIFVCGASWSGTTLMLSILGSHPSIYAVGKETHIFHNKGPTYRNASLEIFYRKTQEANKSRWVEKTPQHIGFIDQILEELPEAKVVVMRKDIRNLAAGLLERVGRERFDEIKHEWIPRKIRQVKAGYEGVKESDSVKIVDYEALVTNTETVLREVFEFVGEEYDPAVLNFHKSLPVSVAIAYKTTPRKMEQLHVPIFDGSEKWKTLLTPQDLEILNT